MATLTYDLIRDELITALDESLNNAFNDTKNFTPSFLATIFSQMEPKKQGEFFNEIAEINHEWDEFCYIKNYLSEEGRELIAYLERNTD